LPSHWNTLSAVFIGGNRLHRADWYIINLVEKTNVPAASSALSSVSVEILKERYYNVNQRWFHAGDFQASDEQFYYVFHWFERIRSFFAAVSSAEKHVLFTSQYQ
jgi:hypothetical protein